VNSCARLQTTSSVRPAAVRQTAVVKALPLLGDAFWVVSADVHAPVMIFPNPLNPRGSLRFHTTQPGRARALLFDPAGRVVRVLMDERALPSGNHTVSIDLVSGGRLASGIYFYRIETREGVASGRLVVAR
jgi:hypothetical protein